MELECVSIEFLFETNFTCLFLELECVSIEFLFETNFTVTSDFICLFLELECFSIEFLVETNFTVTSDFTHNLHLHRIVFISELVFAVTCTVFSLCHPILNVCLITFPCLFNLPSVVGCVTDMLF